MNTSELQKIKQRYNIVGNSDGLNRALDVALQVAPTDLSVLIIGESGVGKEIIPRIIHDNSPRRREKYFAINCGSIPEGTIDSELFGHEKGSFTGAIGESEGYFGTANKGTIFLDEVGELPLATQARLLRVLETGEYICGGQRPNIIDKPTPFKETLLLAESSMFGSSIASYRNNPGKTYVKSLFHAAYRREVFEKVGFFNEELVRTEDNEIHYRMRKAGYKLCFDPDIISYQYTRSSLKAMLKQKYANGYWIGKTSKVCPKCLSIYHFVPFAFVSAIIASGSVIGATGLAECIKKRHNHTLGKVFRH